MPYNRCGNSGLKLPLISLGLWHNFGGVDSLENGRKMIRRAFDLGITHFDLANNYGPPAGSAEENFGRILSQDLKSYRDELIISSKAGYLMWPGPTATGVSQVSRCQPQSKPGADGARLCGYLLQPQT
ncbi:MAG: aldo/keto reductase [Balneolaceae bacterium]|nr:aldo/keto reductase [Balneolaceae bacterium]